MFNWIVSDTYKYLELFNFVDMFIDYIYLIYMHEPDLA